MDETANGRRTAIVTKQPNRDADSIKLRSWATPSPSSKEDSASNHNRRIQRALQDLQGVDEINIRQTLETIGKVQRGYTDN